MPETLGTGTAMNHMTIGLSRVIPPEIPSFMMLLHDIIVVPSMNDGIGFSLYYSPDQIPHDYVFRDVSRRDYRRHVGSPSRG